MSRVQSSSSASTVGIKDTAGNSLTSTSGALDVNVVSSGAAGVIVSMYNEITSVAMASSAAVLSYTVPIGQTLSLQRVSSSSDSIGTIEIDISSAANAKQRFSYTDYNLEFIYESFQLVAGTVITILATNQSLQGAASFNATLQGVLN